MMKFFASIIAMAMVFSVASVAQAHVFVWPSSDVEISNEHTNTVTIGKSYVDTGSVTQFGGKFAHAVTGDVYSVQTSALSQVNMTQFGGCACSERGDVTVENEHTDTVTVAKADVDTGKVSQIGFQSWQSGTTGKVSYVATDATSVVNYTDFSVETPSTPN